MMGPVNGRSDDLIITRDGRRIGMLGASITIHNKIGILKAQLVQRTYDQFECRIVLDPLAPPERAEVEAEIERELAKRIGYSISIAFQYLHDIPRGSRGKFKNVIVEMEETPLS
jgi:phenylacetate-coenzyme A ligase PaaK-like adenylate-forming protein